MRHLVEIAGVVGEPLEELGLMASQHRDEPIEYVVDVHDDVGLEAAWLGEGIGEVENHRAGREVRHVGTDGGHRQQVRRVLDEQAGEPMVGMIVGRSVSDDQVGPERPDQADDLMAILQAVVELPIGMIEDLVGRTDGRRGGLGLASPPARQFGPGHRLMPRPAVGQAHHPDDVPSSTTGPPSRPP